VSRPRLADLGLELPSLPTTTVGSLPPTEGLVEARRRWQRGEIDAGEAGREARHATEHWLRVQERVGLDVLVDGQVARGDMIGAFAAGLAGFARVGLVRAYGSRYYEKAAIVGPVAWQGPITVSWWEFVQGLASRPVKAIITGPYTIAHWSFDEHYPDRASACLAIAAALRRELEALVGAGARIVQIDEPALGVRSGEWPLAIDALHVLTDDLPAYVIAHACDGAFAAGRPAPLDLPVDNLDLSLARAAGELPSLVESLPSSTHVSVGVVAVQQTEVPHEEEIAERIRSVSSTLGPAGTWITPDCGLRARTAAEAEAILTRMVQATRDARARLSPRHDASAADVDG
jgi:5-methyltetrahydropteroyltriglutamate--homocysteine methyltransferase